MSDCNVHSALFPFFSMLRFATKYSPVLPPYHTASVPQSQPSSGFESIHLKAALKIKVVASHVSPENSCINYNRCYRPFNVSGMEKNSMQMMLESKSIFQNSRSAQEEYKISCLCWG